jgi:hypothetical protein
MGGHLPLSVPSPIIPWEECFGLLHGLPCSSEHQESKFSVAFKRAPAEENILRYHAPDEAEAGSVVRHSGVSFG